jgi:hypothetical protein
LETLVKIPLLPDTDVARIAPLSADQKEGELELFRITFPPYGYQPFRKTLGDTLNAQQGFLPPQPRIPFKLVEASIRAECRKVEEIEPNLQVAEGLYNHAASNGIEARTHDMRPLILGGGIKLTFWHSLILIENGSVTVPFFDPRRSTSKLTPVARRFVYSAMHERLRVLDPDFADVNLRVYQFTTPDHGPRTPKPYPQQASLFSFEELDHMVRETYEIWTEVFTRRTERQRKRTGGL